MSIFSRVETGKKNPAPPEADKAAPETDAATPEKIRNYTGKQLEEFMHRMEKEHAMPKVMQNPDVKAAFDKRMEELHLKQELKHDTHTKWQSLKDKVGTLAKDTEEKAEKSFAKALYEKGGMWSVLMGGALSILSWLGFKSAKNLKKSITDKGMLRTAIESPIHHPVFAMFLAATGFAAGSTLYEFFKDNEGPLLSQILATAKDAPMQAAQDLGGKIKNAIAKAGTSTLDGALGIIAKACGGTFDKETGQINLPHGSLHPPVLVAYAGGVRRRNEQRFSGLILENNLKAALHEAETGFHQTNESRKSVGELKRLQEIMHQEFKGKSLSEVELRDRDALLQKYEKTLSLDTAKMTLAKDKTEFKGEARKLVDVENEMHMKYGKDLENFRSKKADVLSLMHQTEENIKSGKTDGLSKTQYAEKMRLKVKEAAQKLHEDAFQSKKADAEKFADAFGTFARNQGKQDPSGLEKWTQRAEALGFKMRKNLAGKFIMNGFAFYSMAPLVGEGLSTGAHVLTGQAEKINMLEQKAQTEALNNIEQKQLARMKILEQKREKNQLTTFDKKELATLEAEHVSDTKTERTKVLAKDVGQVAGGFIPVVGEYLDAQAAYTGKDLNGRELSTESRVLSGIMAATGAASITLIPFTGGLSLVAMRSARGLAAGRKTWQIVGKVRNVTVGAKNLEKLEKTAVAGRATLKGAETLAQGTRTVQAAIKMQNGVHMVQRTAQIYTYGNLGMQMASGLCEFVNKTEEKVGELKDRAIQAVDPVVNLFSSDKPETPAA